MSSCVHTWATVLDALDSARCNVDEAESVLDEDNRETLRYLTGALDDLQQAVRHTVTAMRSSSRSWTEIGEALGTSRQGAQQRYGPSTV